MSWVDDILNQNGDNLRSTLDSAKSHVYEYCNQLVGEGADYEEAHAIALGLYDIVADKNALQMLYFKYIEDWFEEMTDTSIDSSYG